MCYFTEEGTTGKEQAGEKGNTNQVLCSELLPLRHLDKDVTEDVGHVRL